MWSAAFALVFALMPTLPLWPRLAPDPLERPAGDCHALGPSERIQLDWDGIPLARAARLVGCALSRNIVFQPATLGTKTVTMFGPKPFGRRELATLWAAVLADAGLIGERHGAYEVVRVP